MFGGSTPEREAKQLKKKGPPARTRALVEFLEEKGLAGVTILDVGFGVGGLHLELLRRGAASAVGVEIVPEYLEAATRLAAELGFADRVEYHLGDFALMQDRFEQADIVVLDRSVCCYPDMPALVGPSARKARRFCAIIVPMDFWLSRLVVKAFNAAMRLFRREFRAYLHHQAAIDTEFEGAGLRLVMTSRSTIWRTFLYERV